MTDITTDTTGERMTELADRPATGVESALPPSRRPLVSVTAGLLAVMAWFALTGHAGYVLGFVGFVVALLVSVCLHEGGHYLTARRYGMKATQFFVGFGPTLWSRQRGETEWGVKGIPLGGFVKIVGMTPLEKVDPGDEHRAFYKAPVRQKVVVLAAGSTVHFILASLLIVGGTFAIGAIREQPPAVGGVQECVAPDRLGVEELPANTDPCTLPGSVPAPAKSAGLQAGDIVEVIDGKAISGSDDLATALRTAGSRPITLTVERDGRSLDIAVTPATLERFPYTKTGVDTTRLERVGFIGVGIQPRVHTERLGFVDSLEESGTLAVQQLEGIKKVVTEKLGSITKIYSDKRDPEGFVGILGVGRLSGEVIESDETAGVKALLFVFTVAGLNLFVGLFNLLPLLPLDGGHIAVAVYEGVRDRIRRLMGYRGPFQRVDYQKLLPLTYAVAGVFLVFTLALLGADLFNPIRFQS
jgi:membrane-associated protease RseP (regulator of RpoE activity)